MKWSEFIAHRTYHQCPKQDQKGADELWKLQQELFSVSVLSHSAADTASHYACTFGVAMTRARRWQQLNNQNPHLADELPNDLLEKERDAAILSELFVSTSFVALDSHLLLFFLLTDSQNLFSTFNIEYHAVSASSLKSDSPVKCHAYMYFPYRILT